VYYFDTAGGEYSANDVTTIAIEQLNKSLRTIGYTFVNETNVGETCQVVPHDTFCQTWSAYYSIGRVLDPQFGAKLAKHARTSRGNTAKKIKELFTLFKKLTAHIPDDILDDLAADYAEEVAEDDNIPDGLKVLSGAQIQKILNSYFSDDGNREGFVRLVEMSPINECERVLNGTSLRSFERVAGVKSASLRSVRSIRRGGKSSGMKRYSKTRKLRN